MFTNESYDYHAIVTNDFSSSLDEAIKCYNRRGACEKQFDILKNDFGWNYLPFSNLSKNTVFLYFGAICRNLYNVVISNLSKVYKNVNIHYRDETFYF
ncbi:MAG: transposase [Saprospiraceae bacterium]|nr:transposase [Saprospiraceae bacterium]